MIQLALDTTGDLARANGACTLVGTTGQVSPDVLGQKLRIRLRLLRGEYVLDRGVGVPWMQAIAGKGTARVATSILRRAITTCPGVASLDAFALTVGAARVASVSFAVTSITGDVVTMADFTWSPG